MQPSENSTNWKCCFLLIMCSAHTIKQGARKIAGIVGVMRCLTKYVFFQQRNRQTCRLLICLESVCGRNEMADVSRSYCKARKICSGRWCLRWKNNLSSNAARQGVGTSGWGKMWALVCKCSFTFFTCLQLSKSWYAQESQLTHRVAWRLEQRGALEMGHRLEKAINA